jgi:hypothetical protein
MLASGLGWALGVSGGFAVGFGLSGSVGGVASQCLFGAVLGVSLGTLQWILLRRHMSGAGWWIVATMLGRGAGFALIKAATPTLSEVLGGGPIYGFVNGAGVGTLLGAMQWLVLRGRTHRAGWWVLASGLGAGLGFALDQVVGQLVGLAITGTALVWLLRPPAQGTV